MIVFGWLVLTAIAVWVMAGGLICLYASIGLSGKVGIESWALLSLGAALIYASYLNFPFEVALK